MTIADDTTLIAEIRAGEETAWQRLIARFERRLIAFAQSRTGNRTAAEDIVQDAFLGFLLSLPNYDSTTPLESWLFRITAHKLTDHLRREGRRPRLPLGATTSDSRGSGLPGDARRASSLVQSRERRKTEELILAESLRELLSQWKNDGDFERLACLELLFVLGLPNKAVARRLGLSEQAVANHKSFALRKLKTAAAARASGTIDLTAFESA